MALTQQEKFDKAVECVRSLPKDGPYQPTQDTKLKYYAYFKQATEGDVNTPKPGMFDFVGKAKWEAWNGVKGTSKEDAKEAYVKLLIDDLKAVKGKSAELEKVLQELEA